ncbi:MAG: cytochrome c [Comamonadaceae bacterium]
MAPTFSIHSFFGQRTLIASFLALACTLASAADDSEQFALGKKLFTTATPACAVCHTLKDAGSEGAVGPVFDELQPDAARVAKALRDGLGNMPSFKTTLTDAQINALALYVSTASRSGK